jgi:hypothetical protein
VVRVRSVRALAIAVVVVGSVLTTALPATSTPQSSDRPPSSASTVRASGSIPVAGTAVVRVVEVAPDGDVLVGGAVVGGGTSTPFVARFTPDGSPDTSWGSGGVATVPDGVEVRALEGTVDGRVLVASLDSETPPARSVVVRLDAAGAPDASFTPAELVPEADSALRTAAPVALEVDGGGRAYVVSEHVRDVGGSLRPDTIVRRLTAVGAIDATFFTGAELRVFGHLIAAVPPTPGRPLTVVVSRPADFAHPTGGDLLVGRRFDEQGVDVGALAMPANAADERISYPALTERPGGGFLLSGLLGASAGPTEGGPIAVVGLLPDLQRDLAFGALGFAQDAAVLHGGLTPVDAGTSPTFATDGGTRLVRLLPSGYLDPRVGPGGRGSAPWPGGATLVPLSDGATAAVTGGATVAVAVHPRPPSDFGCAPAGAAGYWMAGADGGVFAFGAAGFHGTVARTGGVVDVDAAPDACGYWISEADGTVTALGAAAALEPPDRSRWTADERLAAMSPSPSGLGAFWFTNLGRVLSQGGTPGLGDVRGLRLNGPILDGVATPSGRGYYMVGSDGGVFTFGDARFRGSMGGQRLNAPVQTLVPTPSGGGYWLVAADGGVFAFGDAPFRGSMGGVRLNQPIVGATAYGDGYLLVAADGGIFDFSTRPFVGSLGATPPAFPIVAVTPVP